MFNKQKTSLSSDIKKKDTWNEQKELLYPFVETSHHYGGRLYCDCSLFSSFKDTRAHTQSGYSRPRARVQETSTSEKRNPPCHGVKQLDGDGKARFGNVMESLDTRRSEDQQPPRMESIYLGEKSRYWKDLLLSAIATMCRVEWPYCPDHCHYRVCSIALWDWPQTS